MENAKIAYRQWQRIFNSLLTEYFQKMRIKLIQGYPYHQQSQGWIEAISKELKKINVNIYSEKKIYNFYKVADVNIYNNRHSTMKFNPSSLLDLKDKNIYLMKL